MKNGILFFILIVNCFSAFATTYYSQGSVTPNSFGNWNSNRLGGGTSPASFLNAGDEFVIQNAHTLYTTAIWTVGSPTSIIRIESGGVLYASYAVLLTGTFELQNGGIYYHDNTGPVTAGAGTSIFGGNESFAPGSTCEIRNWINHTTPLPASVNWGNLVINYNGSIGGNWNQQGALTSIQGNLIIKRTGTTGQDFRLTNNTSVALTIGQNLEIDLASLYIKDGNANGTTSFVQVNGDITINNGSLNLGTVDFKPNNELRFKGNLLVTGTGLITAQSEDPMLVANSNSVQSLFSSTILNASFKVAPGAMIKLSGPISLGSLRALVVAGSLNAGINSITMNGGSLAVSGGFFSSSSKIDMKDGICQVCQGNGTFSFSTGWCATSGDTGIINYSTDTILFNRSLASAMRIGAMNSKGKLLLSNQAVIAFKGPLSGPPPNRGTIELTGNGTLNFDEFSVATGDAFYNGSGGWLVIGASPGLLTSTLAGNIQVTGARNYNFAGVNNYEFRSSLPQSTGNAFPATITGTLKVNNSHPSGLTISSPVTIATGGVLQLENGLVKTNSFFSLTMNRNSTLMGGSAISYIDGPLKKIGEQNFTFPVGKSGRYSPVVINANGGGTGSDVYTVEYFPANPQSVYGNILSQFIDHISTVEYWLINGTASPRQVRFKIAPYSGVTDFSSLVVGYFDGTGWLNLGNGVVTGNPSNGTIEVGAANYGPLTLASTSSSTNPFSAALPVNLVSFTARRTGNQGILNWEISTDMDADRFEVLSSNDNRHFTTVATVNAQDTKRTYQFTDDALQAGTTFYRIRVIEKSGIAFLSKIAALFYERKGVELIYAAPSIIKQQTTLSIASSNRTTMSLRLVDIQGKQIQIIPIVLEQGINTINLELRTLAPGLYYISGLSSEGRSNVLRLLKQ